MLFPKFDQMKNRRTPISIVNGLSSFIKSKEFYNKHAQSILICKNLEFRKKMVDLLGKIDFVHFYYAKEFLEFYVLTFCYTDILT